MRAGLRFGWRLPRCIEAARSEAATCLHLHRRFRCWSRSSLRPHRLLRCRRRLRRVGGCWCCRGVSVVVGRCRNSFVVWMGRWVVGVGRLVLVLVLAVVVGVVGVVASVVGFGKELDRRACVCGGG